MFPSLLPHTSHFTIETALNLVDFIVPLQITKGSREFYFGKSFWPLVKFWVKFPGQKQNRESICPMGRLIENKTKA